MHLPDNTITSIVCDTATSLSQLRYLSERFAYASPALNLLLADICGSGVSSIEFLASCPLLEALHASDLEFEMNSDLSAIAACTRLKLLDLNSSCSVLTSVDVLAKLPMLQVGRFYQLQHHLTGLLW